MGLDLRHSEMEIEGDALAIVKKINVNIEDGSIISAFIKDLKALSEGHRRCHFSTWEGMMDLLRGSWCSKLSDAYKGL
ncbi:hypothetical protein Golax_025720, partial [Gossypium laxum]|nr:hypothetical protein [Gossypium laxum]